MLREIEVRSGALDIVHRKVGARLRAGVGRAEVIVAAPVKYGRLTAPRQSCSVEPAA
jgi:hypothetical protein